MSNRVSGDQILAAIANQFRLNYVRGIANSQNRLIGSPMVTPYDIFRAYRDQNERVSARLVEVPVSKFLGQVPEPSAEEVQAYYATYKDALPDPSRPTPGFKVPRQVQVDIFSIDGNALARGIKDGLTEAELRTAYENRKSEFEIQPMRGDLPNDLFAGHPELTPPVIRPFPDVRSVLASAARRGEGHRTLIAVDKFEKVKKDVPRPVLRPVPGRAADRQEEARKQGYAGPRAAPRPANLKEVARGARRSSTTS